MNILIVDYGIGNIKSIQNAFERLDLPAPPLSKNIDELKAASALILPGVGAFSSCIKKLEQFELINCLNDLVLKEKKPILGICVGMQLMADFSKEGGLHKGLGWIPGEVNRLDLNSDFNVPHVGWNNVKISDNRTIFSKIKNKTHFYFDHSYHFVCDPKYVLASTNYDIEITVAVQSQNIFGVQFHPEKSANAGLKLFRSFTKYIEKC